MLPRSQSGALVDGYSRRISYLRLSVTDRCNLRCGYCLPAAGIPLLPAAKLLSRRELILLARVALETGIKKIRITGGEPLLREDILELLEEVGALPGLERLVLTTNGFKLDELAEPLKKAGVHGLNLSIDSLRPERYQQITRGGTLQQCRAGLDAALMAGIQVKLNVVLMSGVNSDEILDFVNLARELGVEVRFIEYMPTRGEQSADHLVVPSGQVLDTIAAGHELEPMTADSHAGPARRFRVGHPPATVGVISPMTCHFCQDCNRIRVTASGLARSCLFHEAGLDLRPWLQSNDARGLAAALAEVVSIKPEGHELEQRPWQSDNILGPVFMSRLGG